MSKTKIIKREKRLQQATQWVKTYTGKNIVRGYAKHYTVDLLCAITELRMLGLQLSEEYVQAVKRSLADKALQQMKKRETKEKQVEPINDYSDEIFAYIAGYTSGGAPYGCTHEEMEEIDKEDIGHPGIPPMYR